MSDDPTTPITCACPTNSAGDIRCHICGQRVNRRCWNCLTVRGHGPCPSRVDTLTSDIERMAELLAWFVDDEPCQFDHDGGCQAHHDFTIAPGDLCHMEQARRLLANPTPTTEGPSPTC